MKLRHFATSNRNKLQEVNAILGRELVHVEVDLVEPQAISVEEVVRLKATEAFKICGNPVLVEDSGMEFAAWNGLPGALIKWFLDSVGPEGILRMMEGERNRDAVAKTAVGYHDGKHTHVFVGEVKGHIATALRGPGGFGWDPIFIPDGSDRSFAEMDVVEKNAISMRKLALDAMVREGVK